ncbi:MAG: hypothetical protein JSR33_11985, partial [Proteobacteria bacterium]|nr:hypothetical protein [Pseudomonadota bacterium]
GSKTHTQLFAHLLVIQEKLPKDVRRVKPEKLLQSLKQLTNTELQILLGAGKDKTWLHQLEEKINVKRINLKQSTQDVERKEDISINTHPSKHLLIVNQVEQKSSQNGIGRCISTVLNCFLCCRRRPRPMQRPLLSSDSRSFIQGTN